MKKRASLIINGKGHRCNLLNRPCTMVMLSSAGYIIIIYTTTDSKKAILNLGPKKQKQKKKYIFSRTQIIKILAAEI